jgi:chaperonin cofactor prefoldin
MKTIGRFHAWIGALLLAGATASIAQEPAQPNLQSARDTVAKWVETQQILAREKKDWQDGKEILERRIELLESEIRSLEAKVAESRNTLGEADRRRYDLVREGESLRAATAVLAERVERLEGKVRTLLSRSPEPLRARVAPLSQRLPGRGAATALSLGERYQNVIGVLNEVNKFQRDVTVASEIRTLSDGARVEVQALYLGLGQGYYVTADGSAAGVGVPSDEGWEWTQSNELAPAVRQAISILQNESVPAYVPLPVTLR